MKVALSPRGPTPCTPAASPPGATSSCAGCPRCGSRSWRCRGRVASPSPSPRRRTSRPSAGSACGPASRAAGRSPGAPTSGSSAPTRRCSSRCCAAARRPPSGSRRRCARCASCRRRGSLTGALRSQLAVDVLLDVWSRTPVPGTAADVTMTLADALAVTDLVEHFLRPLQLPPPEGAARARHGERPVDARRTDGEVGGGDAGAALRARRLPAGTAARGTPRRLPADGADGARPVLPPAVRARLPRRRRRAAGQRLQRRGGPCAAGRPARPGPHAAQRRRPAGPAPAGGRARACRRSCSRAGSTRSRTSTPWSGPSRWSASRSRTPGSAVRRRADGQRGLRGGDPAARRGPGPRGLRHLRGAGVTGVAGVRGRARRRAVQPVGGAAADGHRGRDVRAARRW